IHGWAGPHLLDAYETERRPIGDMVSNAAVLIMKNRGPAMQIVDGIEDETPAAEATWRAMGERIVAADASQFNSIGVQLAYCYDASPINHNDGSPAPEFALDRYVPSSRPGSRAPHLWRPDGASLYDQLGRDFTLLRLGPNPPDSNRIAEAFAVR